jgi:hypothetical protein
MFKAIKAQEQWSMADINLERNLRYVKAVQSTTIVAQRGLQVGVVGML